MGSGKKIIKITTIVISIIFGFIFLIPLVHGETQITHISIELSQSCATLASLNDTNTCSNEYFIKLLYPELKLKPQFQKLFDEAQKTERASYQTNNAILNHKLACIQKGSCNIFNIGENQKVVYWYNPESKIRPYLDIQIKIEPNTLRTNIIDDSSTTQLRKNTQLIKEYAADQLTKVNRINILDKLIETENESNNSDLDLLKEYKTEKQNLLSEIKTLNEKIKELQIESNPIVESNGNREITFNVDRLYINQRCSEATLKPELIQAELGRIIYYMFKNCQDDQILGKLKDNYHEPIDKHELDITTSPNWQAQQKLKEDMEKCKEKC